MKDHVKVGRRRTTAVDASEPIALEYLIANTDGDVALILLSD